MKKAVKDKIFSVNIKGEEMPLIFKESKDGVYKCKKVNDSDLTPEEVEAACMDFDNPGSLEVFEIDNDDGTSFYVSTLPVSYKGKAL